MAFVLHRPGNILYNFSFAEGLVVDGWNNFTSSLAIIDHLVLA